MQQIGWGNRSNSSDIETEYNEETSKIRKISDSYSSEDQKLIDILNSYKRSVIRHLSRLMRGESRYLCHQILKLASDFQSLQHPKGTKMILPTPFGNAPVQYQGINNFYVQQGGFDTCYSSLEYNLKSLGLDLQINVYKIIIKYLHHDPLGQLNEVGYNRIEILNAIASIPIKQKTLLSDNKSAETSAMAMLSEPMRQNDGGKDQRRIYRIMSMQNDDPGQYDDAPPPDDTQGLSHVRLQSL